LDGTSNNLFAGLFQNGQIPIEVAENLTYLNYGRKRIFVHTHVPKTFNGHAFIFLNPVLDEKNRVQRFQAETARALCEIGFHITRFDYYGTGDSSGEIYDLGQKEIIGSLSVVYKYMQTIIPTHFTTHLLGIRLGADIGLSWATTLLDIKYLHLIEPIFNGKKYISEQRARRKMFRKINFMPQADDHITLQDKDAEDFQGYLLSSEFVDFIGTIDSTTLKLSGKNIYLYKLDNLFSKKNHNDFTVKMSAFNNILQTDIPLDSFWEKLEFTDTGLLTNKIIGTIANPIINV
jgi:hypothetical protein